MNTNEYNHQTSSYQIAILFGEYVLILMLSIVFAQIFHNSWVKYLDLYHTILELFCIFIALSLFISVWFTYNRNIPASHTLGFGYLAIAIFDAFHTFYFLKLNVTADAYFDLSTRYWILGRLSEAIVLYISVKAVKPKLNKWVNLIIMLAGTLGMSYIVTAYHDYLPILLNEQGVTPIKIFLELLIIFIYLTSLWKLRYKINNKGIITYKYIFISLLMSASSEFCFTLYSSVNEITWTVGHVLKITSYFYLLRGTFISTVTYPYERLEIENRRATALSETLNDILDTLPMAVFKYDLNTKIEYVNKKFEELFGCSRKEIIGMTTLDLLVKFPWIEKDERILYDIVQEPEGKAISIIRTFRMSNDQHKKLSIRAWKIRNGVFSMMREAKEEQELQNLHLQTETILSAVNNCVIMIDNNRKIVLCNNALAETVEMDKKDIIGMDINEFNNLINFDARELPDMVLSGSSDNQHFEVSLTTPKGNKKVLMLYMSSIKNVYGEIIGGINVSNDITAHKKQQEKLMQQEKLALLGQMGAAIVHETRNFLTTIKGRCQLINVLDSSEEVQKHSLKINSEVDEVNKIISEFLFLSKPRQTELTEVSMFDIFQSAKSMVEATSLVKGVDVNVKLSTEERYVLCDEGQLKQVILNICKNAVDAMSCKEHKKLVIETGYNENFNEMFIKITDNGKGISSEDLKKIGTPFFTTKGNGTGLGLSVCHNIIKEHKGRIEVTSELGIGTTFTLILPCIEDDDFEDDDFEEVV
jgi:PAS domain S-box-containing protein